MKTDNIAERAAHGARDRSAEARIADALGRRARGLPPGARFPAVRALSAELRASPVTIHRAVAQLVRAGVLRTRPGDGTYVEAPRAAPPTFDSTWQLTVLGAAPEPGPLAALSPPREGAIALGSGYVDETLQPLAALAKAARRAASRGRTWDRQPIEGNVELRRWFARDVGAHATARDVLVVPGGQAALAATFRALVPFGGAMLVESPTYFGAIAIARQLGIRVVPVPVDDEGIRVDLAAAALASSGARAIYVQPAFANPTGIVTSPARREALLELARRTGSFVVEDDYARDLAFAAAPPPPLFRDGGDAVVYVRSLTKAAAPGLRIAAVVARGPVAHRIATLRVVEDMFVSGLLQETALELVTGSAWDGHLRALRQELRRRIAALVEALGEHFPAARIARVPEGGFALFVDLPAGVDAEALAAAALEGGVAVTPGRVFYAAEAPRESLRLSVAAAGPRELDRGVRVLSKAARRLARA